MRKISIVVLAAVSMFGAVQTAKALSCAFRAAPAAEVIYPARTNVNVPQNGVIFVRTRLPVGDFVLTDVTRKRRVAIRGHRTKVGDLLVIRPARPFPANWTYELTLKPKAARGARGMPMRRILARFRTSAVVLSNQPPKIKKPVMKFSKVIRGVWVGVGRSANVLVSARINAAPAVVAVTRAFGPGKGGLIGKTFTQAYTHPRTSVYVASMGKCSRIGKAPPSGTYRVTVTAWSMTGKQSRPVTRAGRIK